MGRAEWAARAKLEKRVKLLEQFIEAMQLDLKLFYKGLSEEERKRFVVINTMSDRKVSEYFK